MVMLTDESVLLIKTTYRPYWGFPGGGVNRGETPKDAAIRETREESGVVVSTCEEFSTYVDHDYGLEVTVHVFIATNWVDSQHWKRGLEIGSREYFPFNALPEELSPNTKIALKTIFTRRGIQHTF